MSSAAAGLLCAALVLMPASASAGAGMSTRGGQARPPVRLTASPAHVSLAGSARAAVRVTNSGARSVVVDVRRAGFALDLRGRPKIVGATAGPRSAARWLRFRPRSLAIRPGGTAAVKVVSRLPARAEPGDHDALLLLTTRRRAQDGVAVRMRLGVVVVVRAPGTVVRRLGLGAMRATRARKAGRRGLVLELLVVNRGNVSESIEPRHAVVSLLRRGRRIARLTARPQELRPRTQGIFQFRYRGRARGRVTARVHVSLGEGRVFSRTYRIRL